MCFSTSNVEMYFCSSPSDYYLSYYNFLTRLMICSSHYVHISGYPGTSQDILTTALTSLIQDNTRMWEKCIHWNKFAVTRICPRSIIRGKTPITMACQRSRIKCSAGKQCNKEPHTCRLQYYVCCIVFVWLTGTPPALRLHSACTPPALRLHSACTVDVFTVLFDFPNFILYARTVLILSTRQNTVNSQQRLNTVEQCTSHRN